MAKVTYEIELTPANAAVIDQVNRILLSGSYTADTRAPATTKSKAAETDIADTSQAEMDLAGFKEVVKKAKADHGEEFVKATLEDNGAEGGKPLGRMVTAIDVADYGDVVAALEAGPTEQASDEDDGFGDEDEEDDSEVDAEAVKTAAKAYAKEVGRDEAKEIMNKHGAATLAKIGSCTEKQLQAMFKEFTA